MSKWIASAPANIALIKYMGKRDAARNLACNPSLSYTLSNLTSTVELELVPHLEDSWEPLQTPDTIKLPLNLAGQQRFLNHLARLKQHFGFQGHFIVRSANNFPHNAGIASSASSFAALTRCACQALAELTSRSLPFITEQARLSALGSGSSGRSFFQPWALWQDENITGLDLAYKELLHKVVVVQAEAKAVSSSEAHAKVSSSLLFANRPERATQRLEKLIACLQNQDWPQAFELVWQEFWDMHALFETASVPFGYLTAESMTVLRVVRDIWQREGDGPIVTVDAGPNVHLLFRPEQQAMQQQIAQRLHQFTLLG
jgi:diphosphomevalonate decarboxylase